MFQSGDLVECIDASIKCVDPNGLLVECTDNTGDGLVKGLMYVVREVQLMHGHEYIEVNGTGNNLPYCASRFSKIYQYRLDVHFRPTRVMARNQRTIIHRFTITSSSDNRAIMEAFRIFRNLPVGEIVSWYLHRDQYTVVTSWERGREEPNV